MLYPTELRARAADIAAPARSCQRRAWLVGLGLLLGSAGLARAGTGVVLERVAPVPVLRLADGGAAALAGIVVPDGTAGMAEEAIRGWLGEAAYEIAVSDPALDRHGRRRVAPARGGASLQEALVAAGLAIAAPEPGIGAGLIAAEAGARARRAGLWAGGEHGPFAAEAVPPVEGRYVLVEGRIARTAPTSIYWYANFGRSYRRDFTVRVPRAEAALLAAAGTDLGGLAGRRVRVRGWLFEENGPMIEVTHPLALEVLE